LNADRVILGSRVRDGADEDPSDFFGRVDAGRRRAPMIADVLSLLDVGQGRQSLRTISRRILQKCRETARAEAGTIFLIRRRGRTRALESMSVQNDRIRLQDRSFLVPYDTRSIAGYVAVTGETVFIDDAYAVPLGRPYSFNRAVDMATGYRTRSILSFPLRNFQGQVIGVMQLMNRQGEAGETLPFEPAHEQMIAPVNAVLGRALEQAEALEVIAEANSKLRQRNRELREERARVVALQSETEEAFRTSVRLLARAAELHDKDTGQHIVRVNEYAAFLARRAGMSRDFCEEIHYTAQLHDVGKMSVDSAILHKKGGLDPTEIAEMHKHTVYGWEILRASDRLSMAAEIALSHHEQWCGGGYPRGLAGEAIPVAARIVAIADVYDALRSARPYKPAFPHERAFEIMTRGDGRIRPAEHFDPKLLDLFARHEADFAAIWSRFGDDDMNASDTDPTLMRTAAAT
jgi:HD-GYP domain-containing protein (c-di-GMP phosphodiesterase class II)